MKIKPQWEEYLHEMRKREIELIFAQCPKKIFGKGLELGAGDGFQTTLLSSYVNTLISTEYNKDHLKNKKSTFSIKYQHCDAEVVSEKFKNKQFDIIFSSNMLEHVPRPQKVLQGVYKTLKDDGVTIHVMPSPFWKLCNLFFYMPNRFVSCVDVLSKKGGLNQVKNKIKAHHREYRCDNLKIKGRQRSFVCRLLLPPLHGISEDHLTEFLAFRKKRWEKEFKDANLRIIRILKGPVASGYGFGLRFLRAVLEEFGITSEYIYIAVKKNSRYQKYLSDEATL